MAFIVEGLWILSHRTLKTMLMNLSFNVATQHMCCWFSSFWLCFLPAETENISEGSAILVLSAFDSSHSVECVFYYTLTRTIMFPDNCESPLIACFNYLHLQNYHSTAACGFIAIVISFWLFFYSLHMFPSSS